MVQAPLDKRAYVPGNPPIGFVDRVWIQRTLAGIENEHGQGTRESSVEFDLAVQRQVRGQ